MGATNVPTQKTLRLWGGSGAQVRGYARVVLQNAETSLRDKLAGEDAKINKQYADTLRQHLSDVEQALVSVA